MVNLQMVQYEPRQSQPHQPLPRYCSQPQLCLSQPNQPQPSHFNQPQPSQSQPHHPQPRDCRQSHYPLARLL